jgi:hypothetical protein
MADGPNITDWISAATTSVAAIGTVGAFAFYLFLREQERTRGARVSNVILISDTTSSAEKASTTNTTNPCISACPFDLLTAGPRERRRGFV